MTLDKNGPCGALGIVHCGALGLDKNRPCGAFGMVALDKNATCGALGIATMGVAVPFLLFSTMGLVVGIRLVVPLVL